MTKGCWTPREKLEYPQQIHATLYPEQTGICASRLRQLFTNVTLSQRIPTHKSWLISCNLTALYYDNNNYSNTDTMVNKSQSQKYKWCGYFNHRITTTTTAANISFISYAAMTSSGFLTW